MKAKAFAPGHITGFFEPVYHPNDINHTGSRGAGINISLGAYSEVHTSPSTIQNIQIYINNKKTNASVTKLALKLLVGNQPLNIVVKTRLELPIGQGFGMSAAGALSASVALCKIFDAPINDAMKATHFAEVQLNTGLGDVIASCFGGMEIRKTPGLPPWGLIEHIPAQLEIILCIIGKKIETKKILLNANKTNKIIEYGKYCTKKILENPSVENFFMLSEFFTQKTGLANKKIFDVISTAKKYGNASMCMLGNSIFASGKTNELYRILSNFGKVYACSIDQNGARIIE